MGLLLKLHLSSYVTRNTQNFTITANVIVLFPLGVMKDVIFNLFNDYTASIYLNGKCKHKHIRPFYMFRYTSQFCRLTDFLVHKLAYQDLSLTLKVFMTGCNQINKWVQKYNRYVDLDQ